MKDTTGTPVDELEGRELDCAVAAEVMGLRICHDPGCAVWGGLHEFDEGEEIPHYSTDITAAWEVAEKVRIGVVPSETGRGDFWFAWLMDPDDSGLSLGEHEDGGRGGYIDIVAKEHLPYVRVMASTAPEAIARAALKAVRGQ